eukprot:CAMPEP_0185770528 /NCGR_PEP_ID=MMETSP1174-20130828/59615_1 /TAXON_ID=35687 /ORGANISM="Dictyocha speculum, Strain CCMP1381" /LENGTH=129 /DNA_ID=CAMNT_0028455995 /DNA_START=13 /DNA_END=402 /DNA_ORIENTATION=-
MTVKFVPESEINIPSPSCADPAKVYGTPSGKLTNLDLWHSFDESNFSKGPPRRRYSESEISMPSPSCADPEKVYGGVPTGLRANSEYWHTTETADRETIILENSAPSEEICNPPPPATTGCVFNCSLFK